MDMKIFVIPNKSAGIIKFDLHDLCPSETH